MRVIKRIAQGFGVLIGIAVLYLFAVAFLPGFSVPEQPLPEGTRRAKATRTDAPRSAKDVIFSVNGTPISAWLYLPENLSAPVPCIVMATGLGGTKDFILEAYAIRFQAVGFAVLVFDYRHFGESGGEPRQLVWIPYQLEDLKAAIEYVRSLEEIDAARIALWGTSLGGGHVVVTAANDSDVACVVAQVPGLDGRASMEMPIEGDSLGRTFRMIMHAQRDTARSRFGLSAHRIPIVGEPGSIALMATPDAYEAFAELVPDTFVNEACARIILRAGMYRPVEQAHKVRCPVLLQIADHDSLIPRHAVEEAAEKLGEYAEVKYYPIGHFDIYTGDAFEIAIADQLEFFRKHL